MHFVASQIWDQRGGWADLSPPLTAQGRNPGANPAQRDAALRAPPARGISGRPPDDAGGVDTGGVQLPPAVATGSHPRNGQCKVSKPQKECRKDSRFPDLCKDIDPLLTKGLPLGRGGVVALSSTSGKRQKTWGTQT